MSNATSSASDCQPAGETSRWLAEQIRPHEAEVKGYLLSHFPGLDADDILQDAYLKLMRVRTLGRIASAKAYFYSVARNTALSALRRRKLYSPTPVNELPELLLIDGGKDAAEIINTEQKLALVVEAIDQLPKRCAEIISLVALDGLSYGEVASRLFLSESTVRVQVARGIQRIATFLKERGEIR